MNDEDRKDAEADLNEEIAMLKAVAEKFELGGGREMVTRIVNLKSTIMMLSFLLTEEEIRTHIQLLGHGLIGSMGALGAIKSLIANALISGVSRSPDKDTIIANTRVALKAQLNVLKTGANDEESRKELFDAIGDIEFKRYTQQ